MDDELRKTALERVRTKREFMSHLMVYAVINSMLILIWAVTGRGYPWFIWPLAGWGMGLVTHALAIWMKLLQRPEEEAIEREVRRMSKLRR